MSELTKYNKVIGLMEQCTVGENLWVKADEAEQQIAYWKRCVETSKSIHQIDNETIRKQLDAISELQKENETLNDRLQYWNQYWNGRYFEQLKAHLATENTLDRWILTANLILAATVGEAIFIWLELL
jgi:hypothetical protein